MVKELNVALFHSNNLRYQDRFNKCRILINLQMFDLSSIRHPKWREGIVILLEMMIKLLK